MKLIKLIFICACLSASIQLMAQDLDPGEVYYTLELIPISIQEDTSAVYQVVVVMDTSDLELFNTVSVESKEKIKDLKVSKEDRKDNDRIKLKDKNYRLDMEEWPSDEELAVTAKKPDGTKVKLKKHPRGSEFYHKVETLKATTWDLKKHEGPDIIEDEKEQ
jgi:hypothetical protein